MTYKSKNSWPNLHWTFNLDKSSWTAKILVSKLYNSNEIYFLFLLPQGD